MRNFEDVAVKVRQICDQEFFGIFAYVAGEKDIHRVLTFYVEPGHQALLIAASLTGIRIKDIHIYRFGYEEPAASRGRFKLT